MPFAVSANGFPENVRVGQMPALVKSGNSYLHRVSVRFEGYKGEPMEVAIRLGGKTVKRQLDRNNNVFLLDVPAVRSETKIEVTITAGDGRRTFPVTLAPVRQWQVNFVQHTHTDIGYTRSQTEILAEQLRYIDYALDYCDATDGYPDDAKFRWVCETSWAVSEYLGSRPAQQIERLRRRVAEGRIELTAMYLNFDELPDEQVLASSLYPLQQYREAGLACEVAMQNDINGIGWCFAEFFPEMGVKYVNMGTHGHRALIAFDVPTVFWWESPSGKKILTYRAEHYHTGNHFGVHLDDFERFENSLLNYLGRLGETGYPFDIAALQYSGYLTDNSPPSTQSSEMVRMWNEKYQWPRIKTAVSAEFFREVETKYADRIQTVRGAWPDWWTDGFGSGAREAAIARITHTDIIAGQAALSFARLFGADIPGEAARQVGEINKALLFYDEHTFGFHNSVRDPYGTETWEQRSLKQSYAWEAYRRAGLFGEVAMGLLQPYIPKADVPTVTVLNPLNWEYSGTVKCYIDHQILPRDKDYEITDHLGNAVSAQAGEVMSDGTHWSLYVRGVPAFGYAQYYIRVKDSPRPAAVVSETMPGTQAENRWYAVGFDADRGTVGSLYDKELGRQLLTPGVEWQFGEFIYELIDSRRPMEEYRVPEFTRNRPHKMRFAGFKGGAIWDSYRFVGETEAGREADNLITEYRIFNTEKKIEVHYELRKRSVTDPEAVYVAFPFEVAGGKVWLDVPGGNIEAGADQIPGSSNDWFTVQNFAAARNDDMQVVMGSREIPLMQFGAINTGRYEAGATPQSTNMYSWPMNNYWVTNFNADQMGGLRWSYFIGSDSDNSIARATRFSWENRIPLPARVNPGGGSGASVAHPVSLLDITADNLLVVSMEPVEGERALLLQVREIGGMPAKFEVLSDFVDIGGVAVCDANGNPLGGIAEFRPLENKFIKISW